MLRLVRRQLDKQLEKIRGLGGFATPSMGWIRAIRESLGMTREQLAYKLKVSNQTIEKLEKSEAAQTISLKNLRKIAEALNCQLVYAIVPKHSLEKTVENQMVKKAQESVALISHSMKLEDQETTQNERQEQVKEMVEELKRKKNISNIWDEDS